MNPTPPTLDPQSEQHRPRPLTNRLIDDIEEAADDISDFQLNAEGIRSAAMRFYRLIVYLSLFHHQLPLNLLCTRISS